MGLWAYVGLCVQSESSSPKQPESTAWEQPECISESLWDLGLSAPLWPYLDTPGPMWAYLGLFGPIWAYVALLGTIWAYLGNLGLCGPIGDYLGGFPENGC